MCTYLGITDKKEGETLYIYQQFDEYNEKEKIIDFSCCDHSGVAIEDIVKFEKLNPSFSVNVFAHDRAESDIYPIRIAPVIKKYHSNLLRIDKSDNFHYIHLNFDEFMGHDNFRRKFYCYNCLHGFATNERLIEHKPVCMDFVKSKITFPKEDHILHKIGKFGVFHSNYIIADFETLGNKVEPGEQQVPNQSYTSVESIHEAITFSYVMIGDGNAEYYKMFSGPNCDAEFVKEMLMHADSYRQKSSAFAPVMRMSRDDWYVHMTSDECCICEEKLDDTTLGEEIKRGFDLDEGVTWTTELGEADDFPTKPNWDLAVDNDAFQDDSEIAMTRGAEGRQK